MQSARNGLASVIDSEGIAAVHIGRRLKRTRSIFDKLIRTNLGLARIHDIGGCRAVFSTQDEAYCVLDRVVKNSCNRSRRSAQKFETRIRDYVTEPRTSGYRALHVYTQYQGRRLEIQLRTVLQHNWATTVEALSSSSGIGRSLKHSEGDPRLLAKLAKAAEMMAAYDAAINLSPMEEWPTLYRSVWNSLEAL